MIENFGMLEVYNERYIFNISVVTNFVLEKKYNIIWLIILLNYLIFTL